MTREPSGESAGAAAEEQLPTLTEHRHPERERRDTRHNRPLRALSLLLLPGHRVADRPDIWKVADKLQMNLRACQAQLVELRGMLSRLDIPASTEIDCPVCGLRTKGPRSLAEHLYLSHDGTVPEQWERAEQIAG